MGETSYLQSNFQGGEWSQTYQGRMDDPHYRTAMAVCLNAFPTEQGAWTRRSGTAFSKTTRGGNPGRNVTFDVNESTAQFLEFTDGWLRFRSFSAVSLGGATGLGLLTTNDGQTVSAISTANPAVVTVPSAWPTGASVIFPTANQPRLQNRIFTITNLSGTTFSLQDAITGTNIDGSALGATFSAATVVRVLEIATSYTSGSWAGIVSVQAETETVLLNGAAPQVLSMLTPPAPGVDATFSLASAVLLDGPYLDPFTGSICTYNQQVGQITLTFSFLPWSSTTFYSIGDYVTSGGISYQAIVANAGNTPAGSPSVWKVVNGGAPVGPNGFTTGDIGRSIRLFSEPQAWSSSGIFAIQAVVKYNDGYWQSLINNNQNIIPGTNAAAWVPVTGINYAQWTWGRVTGVSGTGLIGVGTVIGNMSQAANAFNGTVSQNHAVCAIGSSTVTAYSFWQGSTPYTVNTDVCWTQNNNFYRCGQTFTIWTPGTYSVGAIVQNGANYWQSKSNSNASTPQAGNTAWTNLGAANPGNSTIWQLLGPAPSASFDVYAGGNFTGSPKTVQSVTVIPSSDLGWWNTPATPSFVLNLRASQTSPSSASNGTLLGQAVVSTQFQGPVSIQSSNTTTAWNFIWIELAVTVSPPLNPQSQGSYTFAAYFGQVEIFSPNVANGSVITIQLVGPALLYVPGTIVNTWQAGVYTNSTGTWPTCGCYHEGRLWLGGAVSNRWDSSNSNDLFDFSPTGSDGTVADSNGISFIADADGVNQTFWMQSDAQGVLIGTEGGEWLMQSTTVGLPITPSNVQAHRVTKANCAPIEPVRTEHTLVVVQRQKRKIFEMFPDVFSGKFTAPNLTERARHLTVNFLEEIRYQQELTPTIWARCGDGSLIGCTYKRDTLMTSQGPSYYGWHRHALGSGRIIESIAVGPSAGGGLDALVMVTNDPLTNVRHVEFLNEFFEENSNPQEAWLLDDAVTPASYSVGSSSITINGLWHLNGKTVQVTIAGIDAGMQNNWPFGPNATLSDFTVANGSVTITYGDGLTAGAGNGQITQALCNSFPAGTLPIVVGFTYTSQGQLLRPASPAESGARAGPAMAKKRRHHRIGLQVIQTNGLFVGTDFTKLDPVPFRSINGAGSYYLPALFTGVFQYELRDDYTYDGQICWQSTRPTPALIPAVTGFIETMDV